MGGARFRVVDRDRGRKKLDRDIAALKRRPGVTVGVHASEGSKPHVSRDPKAAPETVLDVAIWNEFGLGVPERSFIRAWFDEALDQNSKLALDMLRAVVAGKMTAEIALERLGLTFVGQIQQRIAQHIDPPNAPATVAAKGSSVPLIDRGQLRQSLTYLVKPRT